MKKSHFYAEWESFERFNRLRVGINATQQMMVDRLRSEAGAIDVEKLSEHQCAVALLHGINAEARQLLEEAGDSLRTLRMLAGYEAMGELEKLHQLLRDLRLHMLDVQDDQG